MDNEIVSIKLEETDSNQAEESNSATNKILLLCKAEPEEITEQDYTSYNDVPPSSVKIKQLQHDNLNNMYKTTNNIVSARQTLIFNKRVEKYRDYIQVNCPKCNLTLEKEDYLRKHVEEMHNSPNIKALTFNKQNICTVCQLAVNSSIYLRMIKHSITHMPHPMYSCNICQNFGDMKRQRIIKHLENEHFQERVKSRRKINSAIALEIDAADKSDEVYKDAVEHVCPQCGKCFSTLPDWRQHINNVHKFNKLDSLNITITTNASAKKEWQCNECNHKSKTQLMQAMRLHAFTHMPFRVGKCKICNKVFSHHNELRLHVEKFHIDAKSGMLVFENPDLELEEYIQHCCPLCGINFDTELEWIEHMNMVHEFNKLENLNISQTKICITCGLKMNTSLSCIQQHCFRHMEFKSLKCLLCQYSLVNKEETLRHIKLFHINQSNCEQHRIQKQKNNVPRDVDFPILTRFLMFYCPKCGENFDSELKWEDHIDKMHNFFTGDALNIHPFDGCSICGWKLKDFYITTMQIHAFKHLPYKSYACKICGFASASKKLVLNHVKVSHRDFKTIDVDKIAMAVQPQSSNPPQQRINDVVAAIYNYLDFFCPQCGLRLDNENDWEYHIRIEHDLFNRQSFNITNNKCNICDTKLPHKLSFWQKHYFSHMPHRAFRCQCCKLEFIYKCSAYQHIRTKHIDVGKIQKKSGHKSDHKINF